MLHEALSQYHRMLMQAFPSNVRSTVHGQAFDWMKAGVIADIDRSVLCFVYIMRPSIKRNKTSFALMLQWRWADMLYMHYNTVYGPRCVRGARGGGRGSMGYIFFQLFTPS